MLQVTGVSGCFLASSFEKQWKQKNDFFTGIR